MLSETDVEKLEQASVKCSHECFAAVRRLTTSDPAGEESHGELLHTAQTQMPAAMYSNSEAVEAME